MEGDERDLYLPQIYLHVRECAKSDWNSNSVSHSELINKHYTTRTSFSYEKNILSIISGGPLKFGIENIIHHQLQTKLEEFSDVLYVALGLVKTRKLQNFIISNRKFGNIEKSMTYLSDYTRHDTNWYLILKNEQRVEVFISKKKGDLEVINITNTAIAAKICNTMLPEVG